MASFQTRLSGKASERRYRFHCSNFLQPLFFENLFLNLKTIKGDLLLVCRSDRRGSRSESCEINIYLIVFQHLWMNFVIADSKCRYFGLHQVWVFKIVLIHEGSQTHHCPAHLRKPALYSFGILICKLINFNSLTLEC